MQTPVQVGQRQTHRHLAVVGLAQAPAVLAGYTHGMGALLRMCRVVKDPPSTRLLAQQLGDHLPGHRSEHRSVIPRRIGHQVMHRLMRRAHILRMYPRGHRLDALPLPRQHQPLEVPLRRSLTIGVTERLHQRLTVPLKSAFKATAHRIPPAVDEDAHIMP